MAYKKRGKQLSEMVDEESTMEEVQDFAHESEAKGGLGKILIIILIIIIILVGGWYLVSRYTDLSLPGMSSDSVLTSDWQAVFLSNGQVYFGKVRSIQKDNLVLNDIYYLQVVNQPLQTTQQGDEVGGDDAQTQQGLTLIKLGNELHGPTDEMVINRDHILLIEKLKSDSRVVEAIDAYLEQQASQ